MAARYSRPECFTVVSVVWMMTGACSSSAAAMMPRKSSRLVKLKAAIATPGLAMERISLSVTGPNGTSPPM